jgi:hypothetical protein
MSKKCYLGDVFTLEVKHGYCVFQFVGHDIDNIEIIRVLRPVIKSVAEITGELINQKEHFFVRFPLQPSYKKDLVHFINNYPIPPKTSIPTYYRSLDYVTHKNIRNWYMIEAKTLKRQVIRELTSEFLDLSPSGIWNAECLREQLEMGWTLETWK